MGVRTLYRSYPARVAKALLSRIRPTFGPASGPPKQRDVYSDDCGNGEKHHPHRHMFEDHESRESDNQPHEDEHWDPDPPCDSPALQVPLQVLSEQPVRDEPAVPALRTACETVGGHDDKGRCWQKRHQNTDETQPHTDEPRRSEKPAPQAPVPRRTAHRRSPVVNHLLVFGSHEHTLSQSGGWTWARNGYNHRMVHRAIGRLG